MTSQHFDDGWDNWGENWEPNENNNVHQNSQQNQQYVQQAPLTSNAPIYSPFSYQQSSQPSAIPPQQNPFTKSAIPTTQQALNNNNNQPQYGNPVNFFNPPTQYDGSANVNNNNMDQYAGNQQQQSYSFVQSPIPTVTMTSSMSQQNNQPQFETVKNYQFQKDGNQVQYVTPPPVPQNSLPPQQQSANYASEPTHMTSSVPTQQQPMYSSNNNNLQAIRQPRSVATPPNLMQNYDANFNATQPSTYQFSQWNDQRSQNNDSFNNVIPNWQQQTASQIPYNNLGSHQMPPLSSGTEWQNHSQQPTASSSSHSLPSSSTSGFYNSFEAPLKDERQTISQDKSATPPVSVFQPQQPKFENVENIQSPELAKSLAQNPPQAPSPMFSTAPPPKPDNLSYPENRERLDDLIASPPMLPTSILPPANTSTATSPSIDRHNYLVTGQLSQEIPAFNSNQLNQQHQQENAVQESFNDNQIPPGLSRMVVGEPENNQQQVQQPIPSEILPPRSNRMVTGTEMTPASFMNYQRQADGEVSHEPSIQRPMPVFNPVPPPPMQRDEEQHQQNFNISDRNLYLVAGESEAGNSQRVITGVESNAPMNIIMNPLQNLHIEDDEDFVNISVTNMTRNVDGDGMEEAHVQQQQAQHPVDSSQQREEEIEGANDNNAELVNVNAQQAINIVEIPSIPHAVPNEPSPQNDIREDIEGGNDSSDAPKPPPAVEEKRKSIDSSMRSQQQKQNLTLSSEDSELRELEKNMKAKAKRNKKYDSDASDSASEEYKGKSSSRYEGYSKKNRERVRDEMEKYRKKEKERRSVGRSRRNEDTDGSRYGDSRRRTDDEDDDRRKHRNKNRDKRMDDENDGEGKERDRKDRRNRDPRENRRKEYDNDDRRRERRRRDKYYDNEGYPQGRHSRNESDREFHREEFYRPGRNSRGPYEMQGYYPQPSYPYDPSYYYQQQYSEKINTWLEQVRLTNPQAYEWYKQYYAGMLQKTQIPPQPSMDDIGGSLRSGYNSSSERASTRFISGGIVTKALGSLNSSFIDNTNDYQSLQQPPYQAIGKDFNQAYASLNNYNNYDMYGDSRVRTTEVAPSRNTPQKFQCLHGFVKLTNGLMITVDTYNTDEKYSVKIENVPIFDKTRRLYQSFPGPLIRGTSHKKTVIEFCEDQLKQNSHVEAPLRSSYALLWSYLILMIRQNGSYTEQDIAELLMKNSEEYRASDVDDNKSSSNHNNNSNEVDDENATDVSESEGNATSEHNSASQSNQVTQSISGSVLTENVVLDKFKSYLLYGNINDALDFATDNNLWGHALFLASKVDRRQHANVMLKFANKLSYNDPLQTLYQIMSGRMPACVTNFDDKWGDWRPHLAMIISNCTDKPDLVKRSVLALGDTLASRGDVYGSQFCYLLIDPQFTDYSDTTMTNGKIALLGTTIQKPFIEFASNDCIIMTEVYEYARSLNTENYFIASLQNYKFLLATNMLDYGLKLKCLLYMEQISNCIIQQPQLFDNSFISKVYSLGDRLKFYDPVMEKMYEENPSNAEGTEDQKWLQDLAIVLQNQTGQFVPAPGPTYATNDIYNPMSYQPQQEQSQPTPIYDPVSQHQTPVHVPTVPTTQSSYEEHDVHQYNYEQQNQPPVTYDQNAGFNQYQQQPDQQQMQNFSYGQPMPMQNDSQGIPQSNEQQQNLQQNYLQQSYDPNAQYQQNDYGGYGYDQPKPNITMGAAVSHKFNENQSQDKPDANQKEDKKSPVKKAEPEKKKPAQAANSSGWFSSLFRLGKAPNQMILPDDKNPAIVWDEATKKWVNKDEDPSEAESFKPPPKMGEMGSPMPQSMPNIPQQLQPVQNIPQSQPILQQPMQQTQFMSQNPPQQQMMPQNSMQNHMPQQSQQQQQQVAQNATEETIPSVPSAPNMFKMQKSRNLKKSYVDILGNAGKTVSQPKELAPQMDMQFFNPAQQPQGMQFYNPNDFQ